MPDTTPPPYIPVITQDEAEIAADKAELYVTVRGSSFFAGDTALKKAREVGQLVTDLKGVGLTDDNIHFQGVRSETVTGTFTKTSTAIYDLKIQCPQLPLLADVIGVITSQKNTELRHLQWRFPDLTPIHERLLDACILAANRKADRIARALNVRLEGIYSFSEKANGNATEIAQDVAAFSSDLLRTRSTPRIEEDTFGTQLSHTKTIQVKVEIKYLISGFIPEGQT